MSLSSIVKALVEAGASPEMILAAVQAAEADELEAVKVRREKNAERQRKHRARNAMSRDVTVTERDNPAPLSPPDKEPPTPQEINPPISPHPGEARRRGANPIIVLQSVLDTMASQRWVSHCGDKGRRMSVAQAEEMVETLRQVKARGANPNEAVQLAIRKGWVSIEIEYLENAGFLKAAKAPAKQAVDWADRLRSFYEEDLWPHAWGPKPGEPGCDAPAELVREMAA